MNSLHILGILAWAVVATAFIIFACASWGAVKAAWRQARQEMRELRREKLEAREREALRRAR